MATIEQLQEQAQFLLQQHHAAHEECSKNFASLLSYIQEKTHQEADEESAGILTTVYDALKKQGEELDKNMREDIDFLNGQIKVFTEVLATKDPAKKEELSKLVLEDAGEIQSTEDFKKEVLLEAEENRKSLSDMISDIRQTIEEGGAAELEMLFEAMTSEGEEGEQDECCDAGCEQDPTDLENSCCGSMEEDEDGEEDEEDDESDEEDGINIFEHLEKAEGPKSAKTTVECCGGKNDCAAACVCNENCKCQ